MLTVHIPVNWWSECASCCFQLLSLDWLRLTMAVSTHLVPPESSQLPLRPVSEPTSSGSHHLALSLHWTESLLKPAWLQCSLAVLWSLHVLLFNIKWIPLPPPHLIPRLPSPSPPLNFPPHLYLSTSISISIPQLPTPTIHHPLFPNSAEVWTARLFCPALSTWRHFRVKSAQNYSPASSSSVHLKPVATLSTLTFDWDSCHSKQTHLFHDKEFTNDKTHT